MVKYIVVKNQNSGADFSKLMKETVNYVKYFGFNSTKVMDLNTTQKTYHSILFFNHEERILIEHIKDHEEMIKFTFFPLNINVMYDVIFMRLMQIKRIYQDKFELIKK